MSIWVPVIISQYHNLSGCKFIDFSKHKRLSIRTNNLNVPTAATRSLPTQIIRIACRRDKDPGEAKEGLARVAVGGVHRQGVAGNARDVEVGDTAGAGLAGVAAVVGVGQSDEFGVEPLMVWDHGLGGVGTHVRRVGRAGAGQRGAGGDDGGLGLEVSI